MKQTCKTTMRIAWKLIQCFLNLLHITLCDLLHISKPRSYPRQLNDVSSRWMGSETRYFFKFPRDCKEQKGLGTDWALLSYIMDVILKLGFTLLKINPSQFKYVHIIILSKYIPNNYWVEVIYVLCILWMSVMGLGYNTQIAVTVF